MGRITNGTIIVANPATRFIQWLNPTEKNSEKGVTTSGFYYWDKEKETNVGVDFPFVAQYLQDAVGITGYLEKRKKNIYSNEVLDVYETPFDIKVWGEDGEEVLKTGFYYSQQEVPKSEMSEKDFKELKLNVNKEGKNGTLEMIKDAIKGAKKCKILYLKVEDEIWRMKLSGSNLTAWDEFQKVKNGNKYKTGDLNTTNFIIWSDIGEKPDQNGKLFKYPIFSYKPMNEEQIAENNRVYSEQIEPYFNFMLNKPELTVKDEAEINGDY